MLPIDRRLIGFRHARTSSALVAVGLMMAGPAAAQDVRIDMAAALQTPAVQAAIGACMSERSRLCPDIMPGGGRIVRCLAANMHGLTPRCRSAMMEAHDVLVSAGIVELRAPPPSR